MPLSIALIQSRLDQGRIALSELLAIRREFGAPFRFHPLGFIACTLLTEGSLKLRLHYWPARGGAQQSPECQIHDHLFEFQSWVLSGAVENIEYVEGAYGTEYSVYETEYHDDQSILTKTGRVLPLIESSRTIFSAGTSYSVRAGTLHETVRVGSAPAFTVLITRDVSDSAPLVLGPEAGLDRYVYTRSIVEDAFAEGLLAAVRRGE